MVTTPTGDSFILDLWNNNNNNNNNNKHIRAEAGAGGERVANEWRHTVRGDG